MMISVVFYTIGDVFPLLISCSRQGLRVMDAGIDQDSDQGEMSVSLPAGLPCSALHASRLPGS